MISGKLGLKCEHYKYNEVVEWLQIHNILALLEFAL